MSRFMSLVIALATIGITAAIGVPARAQCRLCDQPSTQMPADSADGDVQLSVETGLDFDRMIFTGSGSGAATVRPDGSNAAEGVVTAVGPRARVGTVLVHGQPGRALRVELPHRIELYSLSGGRITLDQVATDLPPMPRLDSAGNLSFRFGGRLVVSGDSDGQFRGDLPITVEYL
jgi:hypothetical protein